MSHSTDPIVTCARQWLGMPFRHQGRSDYREDHQHAGVDCLGLLIGVARHLALHDQSGALLSEYDRLDYGMMPDEQALAETLGEALCPASSPPKSGMVALCAIRGRTQHLGIITPYHAGGAGLIHAYAPAGKVVEHALDASWQRRIHTLYQLHIS